MTSLYLAGRFATGPQLEARADEARGLGLAVTSRWHAGDHGDPAAAADLNDPNLPRYAREDIEDLLAADVVVSFTEGGGGKGGRHVEFGLGLGYRKRLVVVGPREHVFHTLPTVEQYDTCSLALGALMVDAAVTEYLDDTMDTLGAPLDTVRVGDLEADHATVAGVVLRDHGLAELGLNDAPRPVALRVLVDEDDNLWCELATDRWWAMPDPRDVVPSIIGPDEVWPPGRSRASVEHAHTVREVNLTAPEGAR